MQKFADAQTSSPHQLTFFRVNNTTSENSMFSSLN